MTDKRKFSGSICARCDTSKARFELSPAELYSGPVGMFRVRLDRRWLNSESGQPRFFNWSGLAALLAETFEEPMPLPAFPDIPRGSRVTVKYWGEADDLPHMEGTRTDTPPVRLHDGLIYVGCYLYGKGFVWIHTDNVLVHGARHEQERS